MKRIRNISLALATTAFFCLSTPIARPGGFHVTGGSTTVVTTKNADGTPGTTVTTTKVNCKKGGSGCGIDANGNFVVDPRGR